jgi:hypothetical protein
MAMLKRPWMAVFNRLLAACWLWWLLRTNRCTHFCQHIVNKTYQESRVLLFRRRKSFYLVFNYACLTSAANLVLKCQRQRSPAAQIFGAPATALMLPYAPFNVSGNTCIQSPVSATQQVNIPAGDHYCIFSLRITRAIEGGFFFSKSSGRIGRGWKFPPQFGQMFCKV